MAWPPSLAGRPSPALMINPLGASSPFLLNGIPGILKRQAGFSGCQPYPQPPPPSSRQSARKGQSQRALLLPAIAAGSTVRPSPGRRARGCDWDTAQDTGRVRAGQAAASPVELHCRARGSSRSSISILHGKTLLFTTFTSCRVASIAVSRGVPGPHPAPQRDQRRRGWPGEGKGSPLLQNMLGSLRTGRPFLGSKVPQSLHPTTPRPSLSSSGPSRCVIVARIAAWGVPYFIGLSVSRPSHGKVMR